MIAAPKLVPTVSPAMRACFKPAVRQTCGVCLGNYRAQSLHGCAAHLRTDKCPGCNGRGYIVTEAA